MKTKEIPFKAGTVEITANSISFRAEVDDLKEFQTMDRTHIGGINNEYFVHLNRQPTQYGFRYGFGGLALTIAGFISSASGSSSAPKMIISGGIILMLFGLFLIIGDLIIDGLFGSDLIFRLCCKLFGKEGYEVSIQNNSGGDHIIFYIKKGELKQAQDLIKYRKKGEPEPIKSKKTKIKSQSSNLDDLEKLAQLRDKGVITKKEFEVKKKQILGT